ncbi:hypothetical protein SHKM778_73770 [Streptomyces sp. KM77-8]|uniref:Uncharacterized protein n=1 Tax=Streptomyces haneummycinicus TaxID=3074435 RepID=A0AAT9HTT4_9ACTN
MGAAAHPAPVRERRRGRRAARAAEGEWIYAWAWLDEAAGRVRARAFPGRDDGIDEDEATGAAALLLTDQMGRALNITQGTGSQLLTAPSLRAGRRSAAGSTWSADNTIGR